MADVGFSAFIDTIKKRGDYDVFGVDMFCSALKEQIKLEHVQGLKEQKDDVFVDELLVKCYEGTTKFNDRNVNVVVSVSVSNAFVSASIAPLLDADDYWDYPSLEIVLFPAVNGSLVSVRKGYYNDGLGLLVSFTTGPEEESGVFEVAAVRNDELSSTGLKSYCENKIGGAVLTHPNIKYGNQKLHTVFNQAIKKLKEQTKRLGRN